MDLWIGFFLSGFLIPESPKLGQNTGGIFGFNPEKYLLLSKSQKYPQNYIK